MLPTIPPDAPAWVPNLYWIAFAVFGALFAVSSPRFRAMLAKIAPTPAPPEASVRIHGPALGPAFDGVKLGQELERIADALEGIQQGVQSLAKSEEAGQVRMLESIAKKLDRLDRSERSGPGR